MKYFAVLSSRSSLQVLKTMHGYAGAIYIEKADAEISLNINNLPPEIDVVFIEFSNLAAVTFFWMHHEIFSGIDFQFFDLDSGNISWIDVGEVERKRDESPAAWLANYGAGSELLKDFEEIKFYTQGQISYLDAMGLFLLITQHFAGRSNERPLVGLEVGSWLGASTYFIAKTLQFLTPRASLVCMDRWANWVIDETADSRSNRHWEIAEHIDIFGNFKGIMKTFDTWHILRPMLMDARCGLPLLAEGAFDLVFIDAGHNYDSVYHDVAHAIRIVKKGGLLMCHDCGGLADKFPEALLEKEKNDGPTLYNGKYYYLGVTKALSDHFGSRFRIFPGSTIAFATITEEDKRKVRS